jgi:hypothetical protein
MSLEEQAREERLKQDYCEFQTMSKQFAVSLFLSNNLPIIDDFSAMAMILHLSFKTLHDGHVIHVTKEDLAIMMRNSALEATSKTVLMGHKYRDSTNNNIFAKK